MYQPVRQALQKIGLQGKYQKILIVFLFLIAAEANYLLFGPTFIFMNPLFKCSFTNELVDESIACDRISQCTISTDFTIVAQAKLYCDRQEQRSIIQSILAIGAIVGLLVINYLSDTKGRKIGIITAQIIAMSGILLTIVGGLTSSVAVLVVSQFLCGFSGYSMLIMVLIIPSEYCDPQYRQKLIIIVSYAWALTMVLIGFLYYVSNHWLNFLLYYVFIPMVFILIFSYVYLVEGPNFLYGANRRTECLQSLKTIAKYNSTLSQYQQISKTLNFEPVKTEQISQVESLKLLFSDRYYVKLFVCLILMDIGGNLYYFGTNYALDQIGLQYGANMISNGIIEFFSYIVLQFSVASIPRKSGMLITYGIVVVVGLLFIIPTAQNSVAASLTIIGLCRFMGTVGYTLLIMFLTESFPMKVQAISAGIIQSIAQLGSLLGPIIITVCINNQIYPIVMLSIIIFFIILLPLLAIKPRKFQQKASQIQQSLVSGQSNQIMD